MVRITRRDFMKYCSVAAGALGLSASTLMKLDKAVAKETTAGGIPVVWIDGAACTGCSMTLLNSVFYTDAADLLINTLDLNFHKTLMTACGSPNAGTSIANALTAAQNAYTGADVNPVETGSTGVPLYVLVVEGGIQCGTPAGGAPGDYCKNGNLTGVAGAETMLANTQLLASHALAVLSVGTCASFGGVPGAKGSITDSRGTLYKGTKLGQGALLDPSVSYGGTFTNALNVLAPGTYGANYSLTATTPLTNFLGMPIKDVTINIPGCPPHPDWIVGTIASIVSTLPNISEIVALVDQILTGSTTALSVLRSNLAAALPQKTNYYRPVDYGYREYQCNAGPCEWRYNNTPNRATNTTGTPTWTGTTAWPWTTAQPPVGTNSPSPTLYPAEPDFNTRYPIGNSKLLGTQKWRGSQQGCLGILGCKGRKTKADCSRRRWNASDAENYGVNWCVGSRGMCHGCTEPTFPDGVGKFYTFI